jgi:hypothetical protein
LDAITKVAASRHPVHDTCVISATKALACS